MREKLTPESIYRAVAVNKTMTKAKASETLISLIESSDESRIRKESLETLRKLELMDDKIFKILEYCLISDESSEVRATAALMIIHDFPKHGITPLEWALQIDKSISVILTLISALDGFENQHLETFKNELMKKFGKNIQKFEKRGIILDDALRLGIIDGLAKDLEQEDEFGIKYNVNDEGQVIELNFAKLYNKNGDALLENLCNFKHLRKLNLSDRGITIVPNVISNLKSLKYLDLSRNNIKKLPKTIGTLSSLKYLDIRINKIKKIPDSIINLTNLEYLDLRNNLIINDEIPASINAFLDSKKECRSKYEVVKDLKTYKLIDKKDIN